MQIHITAPTRVHTAVSLPSSKSICNRALIIHALAHGTTPLHRLSDCDDTQAMVHALQSQEETVDIGAAGTAMRFLTAYYDRSVSPDAPWRLLKYPCPATSARNTSPPCS